MLKNRRTKRRNGNSAKVASEISRDLPADRLLPVLFKERNLRRAVRAMRKEKLVVKSATVTPDGTISVVIAEPSPPEVSADVTHEIDDLVKEWDNAYGKTAA